MYFMFVLWQLSNLNFNCRERCLKGQHAAFCGILIERTAGLKTRAESLENVTVKCWTASWTVSSAVRPSCMNPTEVLKRNCRKWTDEIDDGELAVDMRHSCWITYRKLGSSNKDSQDSLRRGGIKLQSVSRLSGKRLPPNRQIRPNAELNTSILCK